MFNNAHASLVGRLLAHCVVVGQDMATGDPVSWYSEFYPREEAISNFFFTAKLPVITFSGFSRILKQ